MKSLTGKSSSTRGWALLLILFLGAGLLVAACGDEETPAPTTPTPPPAPPPPAPEPEPEPEKPATPTGLQVASKTASSITWTWNAVEGAHGYVVQASMDETFDETDQLALTVQPSYTATPLSADTSVYLRVAAGVLTAATPSLDPSDYLLSDWTTHVTGTTDADASAGLAAPTNVRVTAQTATTITWSWNAVEGAAGYRVQHGDSAMITDDDPTAFSSTTSHTVSNLESRTDRYLRVQAYSGTLSEPVFGDWSTAVEGTTGEPPPPPPATALDAPENVGTSNRQNNSITVTWDEVDDAVEYEVEQSADGGSFGDANCGSATGSNTVTGTSCVASGLDQATDYDFRVKAFPDSADTALTASAWSSTVSATTTGSTQAPPVTGGDDDLNITWESDADSITWYWDPSSDRRITYLVALLKGMAITPSTPRRPACPPLTTDVATFADISDDSDTNGWFDNGSATSRKLGDAGTPVTAGEVRGLCVVRTWEDENRIPQYGDVSVAWAATAPAIPAAAAETAEDGKTAVLKWTVTIDQGFEYEVRTAKAIYASPSDLGSCPDDSSRTELFTTNRDNGTDTFEIRNPDAYTEYSVCVRAKNDAPGESSWTSVASSFTTRPSAPPSLTGRATDLDHTGSTNTVTTATFEWSFGVNERTPETAAMFNVQYFTNASDLTMTFKGTESCDATGGTAVGTGDLTATASGFKFSQSSGTISFNREATGTGVPSARTGRVLVCARAQHPTGIPTGTDAYGPWSAREVTVTVPRQP